MRTSISHPLQIAAVSGGSEFGRVGLTFCPGKYDPHAMSGGWDRELARDLDTIRDWGAAAVVTLLEPQELALLRVEQLGEEVFRRHMSWFHLPITDVSTPDERFERAWGPAGEELRSILRNGFDVLVHCRGGLGRAGTIAARLLVELGMVPATAIAKVREVRPGAIETRAQENFVLDIGLAQERFPLGTEAAIRDRAVGSFVGLAIGDAVGTTLEFKPRDSYKPLRDMVGGGPFHLNPGEWTDDTSMALCLADSLIETKGQFDPGDLMHRFVRWRDGGENSANDRGCFDIGSTTNEALSRWLRDKDPYAGSVSPHSAGNGSLMRLAPVATRFWNDRDKMRDVAGQQSRTTHAARKPSAPAYSPRWPGKPLVLLDGPAVKRRRIGLRNFDDIARPQPSRYSNFQPNPNRFRINPLDRVQSCLLRRRTGISVIVTDCDRSVHVPQLFQQSMRPIRHPRPVAPISLPPRHRHTHPQRCGCYIIPQIIARARHTERPAISTTVQQIFPAQTKKICPNVPNQTARVRDTSGTGSRLGVRGPTG
jgi:ADP-ribosyl-[dinitrogen reductase] hydrolase